jgi:hypothetical protein
VWTSVFEPEEEIKPSREFVEARRMVICEMELKYYI